MQAKITNQNCKKICNDKKISAKRSQRSYGFVLVFVSEKSRMHFNKYCFALFFFEAKMLKQNQLTFHHELHVFHTL